ncbi:hypothetical protein [Sporosarcina psychrophila]|uniref:hypothetical protein n=1 Tax=Sporosarcina psychrophila TaxID=1476 RepID=UPI00078DDEA9|nr:hypothetical protein [Sporosarcina psychrophila]AMQ06643.1 hypothetical protein AZE41_12285 [Sporosarcina psychrophila]
MELTTLEAIQYCIAEGIEGAEKRLQSYERRGRIDNSSVLEALIKDLQTIHVSCEFKTDEDCMPLKGSKRRFILGEKRSERAERLDGRKSNGAIREEDRKLLDEHIFRTIIKLEAEYWSCEDTVEITTTALIKNFALINPNVIEHKKILRIINENIFGESKLIYAQTITEYIRAYIRDTNRNILTSSLKAFEKSDRIILSYRYYVIDGTGNNEVDENGYNTMKAIIESEIEGYNHWNDTSYTLNAFQKMRAKEKRFRGEGEHAFLKHMEEKCKVLVYKKNVIRILEKESIQIPEKMSKQVYSDILLKRVKKHYVEASTTLDGSFFERYRSFILAKVIESFEVELPDWCLEYFIRYSNGFGRVTFHEVLLTEEEKKTVGLIQTSPYSEEEIEAQVPF